MMAEDVKLPPAGGVELPPTSSGGVTVSASGIPARAAAVGITPRLIGVSGICKVVRPGSGCGHLVMCATSC